MGPTVYYYGKNKSNLHLVVRLLCLAIITVCLLSVLLERKAGTGRNKYLIFHFKHLVLYFE